MANEDDGLTRTSPIGQRADSGRALDSGRFVAGTLLAGRYRIVGLLGRGGMGEVYKAEDLRLGQAVALKFLPPALTHNAAALARFHQEIQLARKVSHPNVCRVYDVAEAEGASFLTMEFIDGEDLAGLLKRIGRLPADKAIEVARQIAAGLAAAHDQGVLHRDLKPANVMLDGRGRARLTDFGLATFAEAAEADARVAGTLPYMAPELLAGGAATVKSDLYALGLVFYELFTGKRAFGSTGLLDLKREQAEVPVKTPSSWVRDLDPLVERAVMRCLETDPARRPASAVQVLGALPGGDPLEAALLAGETPSPEVVAAAGSREAMPVRTALAWTATIAISLVGQFIFTPRAAVTIQAGTLAPDVLAARGRSILEALGHRVTPADSWSLTGPDFAYQEHVRSTSAPGEAWRRLTERRPHPDRSVRRESPRPLVPLGATFVRRTDPPPAPGMAMVEMDGLGRLKALAVVPDEWDTNTPAGPGPNWSAAFALADLRVEDFASVPPERAPPHASDTRAAWTGRYPNQPEAVRIEAAAYRGRIVFFDTIDAWERPAAGSSAGGPGQPSRVATTMYTVVTVIILIGGAVLAWRTHRAGRGDSQGAGRLGAVVFVAFIGERIAGDWPGIVGKPGQLWLVITEAIVFGVLAGLLYFGLEPIARKRWPTAIISWSRLLAGRWRDALVGRDVLVGTAFALLLWTVNAAYGTAVASFGNATLLEFWPQSAAHALTGVFGIPSSAFGMLAVFLIFVIVRTLVRRTWLAAVVVWLVTILVSLDERLPDLAMTGLTTAVWLWIAARWGLLVMLMSPPHIQPVLTLDPSKWYFGGSVVYLVFIVAAAWYGFRTATARQRVVPKEWLEA